MKKILHLIEAFFVYLLYAIFRIIGVNLSSALASKIAVSIGPMLKVSKVADDNLRNAMNELSAIERKNIILDMWRNLGRTVGEMPHLKKILENNISIENIEYIQSIKAQNRGYIIISGHFANWEIGAASMAHNGLSALSIYRPANNKYVDKLIQYMRSDLHHDMSPKGSIAAKTILKTLKKKGGVGMLVDQKMNNGISVPFFGRPAMTAPAVAEFALKFKIPIIPVQITRKNKIDFKIKVHEEVATDGKTPLQIMTEINQLLESWIRENPSQWFWVHKRWG